MSQRSLVRSVAGFPAVRDPARAEAGWLEWQTRLAQLENERVRDRGYKLTRDPEVKRLMDAVFAQSPFLTRCLLKDIGFFADLLKRGPSVVLAEIIDGLNEQHGEQTDRAGLMADLRRARQRVALAVALGDLGGHLDLDEVTGGLSEFADAALRVSLRHLLTQAQHKGQMAPPAGPDPLTDCGYTILGMGKLGARELNYSSDIDLIAIFDAECSRYIGDRGPADFFVRITRDLVQILSERTADGFVFRTDLRLRPDPTATPLAVSLTAAEIYYESLGQNWERAAMIKARPVAGDPAFGEEVVRMLRPFVWRKHLDFWAIQDIHSIKRQIHAHRGGSQITILGHNIKLGRGGIREIEFFAQTQQLIYGGRDLRLRRPRTVDALAALAEAGRIDLTVADELAAAYAYLRCLEHRLQMVGDQQTHALPSDPVQLEHIAAFMGVAEVEDFKARLLQHLRCVEQHYARLFEEAPPLAGPGSLVFTGADPEPETIDTLERMGFADGAKVFHLVAGWHHGRYRATRSKRSREILTEIMPTLLESLAGTANPDQALARLDAFLGGLPAGVQLFSMLHANPGLLRLLAGIMGSAPALASHLSRNPGLLDAVLSPGFFDPFASRASLAIELQAALDQARDFQDVLDQSRRWANDRKFQAGVHLLNQISDPDACAGALSDIAETVMRGLYEPVCRELARSHGETQGPGLAVVAMGKLGGRETTATSDLDLIFLYDVAEETTASTGPKPLPPSQYFARLAQRFINALTALTAEGRLYEIDMRLRPSGTAGPIAVPLSGFRKYQTNDAWTWEHMALTRARVIVGEQALAARIDGTIKAILTAPRDEKKLLMDVAEMRARIAREHRAASIWEIKHWRGGLVDLEFLAQYWQLKHGHKHPEVLDPSTQAVFGKLARHGLIPQAQAAALIDAGRLLRHLQAMLRFTAGATLDEDAAPDGLKAVLARAGDCGAFHDLKERLVSTTDLVKDVFRSTIELPAGEVGRRDEQEKSGEERL